MNQLSRFWNISFVYGFGYLFVRALSFLLLPLYTNLLSVKEAGGVFVFYTILAFLNTIYSHGMDSSLLKFYNSGKNNQKIITTSLLYSFFVGLFLSSVLVFVNFLFGFDALFVGYSFSSFFIYVFCAILFFDMFSSRLMNFLRLSERPYYYLFVSLVNVFISFGFNYYFLSIAGWGLSGVLWSVFIASSIQLVLLSPVLIINFKFSAFCFSTLKKLLLFALPFFPASIFFILIEVSDRWMLIWLGSIQDVGLYGAGYKVGSLVLMVVLAFNINWQPFYLKKNQNVKFLVQAGNLFVVLLVFITTALSSFWPLFIKTTFFNISLVGEGFWDGGAVIPLISISYFFYGLFVLQMPSIYLKNKQNWIPLIWGFGLLVNFVSNYFLIQFFGFMGAAYSTCLTYFSMFSFLLVKNRTWFPLPYNYCKIASTILIGLSFYFLSSVFVSTHFLFLLMFCFLVVVVFFIKGFLNGNNI